MTGTSPTAEDPLLRLLKSWLRRFEPGLDADTGSRGALLAEVNRLSFNDVLVGRTAREEAIDRRMLPTASKPPIRNTTPKRRKRRIARQKAAATAMSRPAFVVLFSQEWQERPTPCP